MKKLIKWYNSRTKKGIKTLRFIAIFLSIIPIIGWIFIAPWLIPLMLYLEFHLKSDGHKLKTKDSKLSNLCKWYKSKTKRQINILRLSALLLSAIPIIGWFFIAPWLIPLILYLEFRLHNLDNFKYVVFIMLVALLIGNYVIYDTADSAYYYAKEAYYEAAEYDYSAGAYDKAKNASYYAREAYDEAKDASYYAEKTYDKVKWGVDCR